MIGFYRFLTPTLSLARVGSRPTSNLVPGAGFTMLPSKTDTRRRPNRPDIHEIVNGLVEVFAGFRVADQQLSMEPEVDRDTVRPRRIA